MYIIIKLFLQTDGGTGFGASKHLKRYKKKLVLGIFRQISRNTRGYKLYRFHRIIVHDINRYRGDTTVYTSLKKGRT